MSNPIVYYTAEEVAALLKITRFTVYKMINRGDLPGYCIGREFRIEASDLDAFIRNPKTNCGKPSACKVSWNFISSARQTHYLVSIIVTHS
ncbi:Helix-turn-helix domain protein [Sporomusa ovata DSM 2662]|uniref:helix-turn-helix domain-containing protein n=1 Tax=Sporomusa ovata TaxID=2378 RepID=UPI0003885067|nr:helix-turn-helix domain-containing protein [Sporomusa ovata]EQB24916.1 DNA binding excisionase family [Sporomusa ovata DSM 2662]